MAEEDEIVWVKGQEPVPPVEIKAPAIEVRDTSANARALRLIESKSVQVSQQKREMIMTQNLNELDLTGILSKGDYAFYMQKKADYLMAYPDLEMDPFDLDDLHLLIIEHIMLKNLMKRKTKSPTADITKEYEACVKRIGDLKKSLSMRRTDRIKNKEAKKQTVNIAQMAVHFSDPEKARAMEERLAQAALEEMDLLSNSDKVSR